MSAWAAPRWTALLFALWPCAVCLTLTFDIMRQLDARIDSPWRSGALGVTGAELRPAARPHATSAVLPDGRGTGLVASESSSFRLEALQDTLVDLETRSWVAWQQRDGDFFEAFLSDDHVEVGAGGVTHKAGVIATVASRACVVHSYAVDKFELTRFSETTALLTYHAAQTTECDGRPVPSPAWATSLYIRRDGRWVNAAYQQSAAAP